MDGWHRCPPSHRGTHPREDVAHAQRFHYDISLAQGGRRASTQKLVEESTLEGAHRGGQGLLLLHWIGAKCRYETGVSHFRLI